jgi:hypothetical protein
VKFKRASILAAHYAIGAIGTLSKKTEANEALGPVLVLIVASEDPGEEVYKLLLDLKLK